MEFPIWMGISIFFTAFVVSFLTEVVNVFRNIEGFKMAWAEKDRRWNNFVYPFIIQTVVIFVVLVLLWYARR